MTQAVPPRTVGYVLRAGTAYLARHHVVDPQAACELLLSRLIGCRRLDVHAQHDRELTPAERDAMRRGVQRVAAGEPVQYVTGETEFLGRRFKVDRRALIPRPETELLVETALGCAPLWQKTNPAILDLGTGSGCIAISLALARPNGLYLAVDVSRDALTLAHENALRHGVADRIGFSAADLSELVDPASLDAIVANLPYVPTAEWERLPRHIRDYEPRIALDGGSRGLDMIELAIHDAAIVLCTGGYLFLEIGFSQADAVRRLLAEAGFSAVQIARDLAGHDRVIWGQREPDE